MKKREIERLDRDLRIFVDGLVDGLGRPERREALGWYTKGLLLDGDRKSIYPMAQRLVTRATGVESMRQRMQQAICVANWSEEQLQARLAAKVDHEMPGIDAFVVDDTGFPKKGTHSVGVARQYSGTLGRTDNCQVAVSLHMAGEGRSVCAGMRLYLPKEWAEDVDRRAAVGVPDTIEFKQKWKISLDQIDLALRAGVRKHIVLADAGYGDSMEYRQGLRDRGLHFLVGVSNYIIVWRPGSNPQRAMRYAKSNNRYAYQDCESPPIALIDLAKDLEFKTVTWRDGSRGRQSSRFAAVRVRTAHHHINGKPPGDPLWLLAEWPKDKETPSKFWFSSLPASTSAKALVRFAKLRWRVERDYQEMKQELGLDHFEGRKWRGFHHHVTMCAVAHAFLALQRALFPPEDEVLDAPDGAEAAAGRHLAPDWSLSSLSSGCSPR